MCKIWIIDVDVVDDVDDDVGEDGAEKAVFPFPGERPQFCDVLRVLLSWGRDHFYDI